MWLYILIALIILFGFMAFTGAPYVPSKRGDVRRAFTQLYELGSRDHLVDIGSGDGVVLRQASSFGARATGYEINPIINSIAKVLSRSDKNVQAVWADFWRVKFPDDTTVVYTFGDARDIARMTRKIESEATRIGRRLWFVSYAFEVPGYTATRHVGAHYLYEIKPLPSRKA